MGKEPRYHQTEDRMQSCLAMTHHIQNRIIQSIARCEVSMNVAHDVKRMCDQIVDQFTQAAKDEKE